MRLFIIRDDGILFGEGGDAPLQDLDITVALPEIPHPSRTWSTAGVKAYRAGKRPDPVDLFQRITAVVNRFMDFDHSLAPQQTMAELVACYSLATWFLPAFNVIGYLWPTGERGSGKTVLLHTVTEMAYLGHVLLAGGTYASLRDLAEYGATLAFDDAENLTRRGGIEADKRALLLAGNRRGSIVTVKERGPGNLTRTRHINAFCPRLFSAIQLPDDVLGSRSIVIPLVRTPDRERANADPLDHESWPHDRRQLIDDLWAVSLAHLPELRQYEKTVNARAGLVGRDLEPWRAILAVALWLDDHDTEDKLKHPPSRAEGTAGSPGTPPPGTGLWDRLHALSKRYQREKQDLEADNITALVVQALYCYYRTKSAISAVSAISAINMNSIDATQNTPLDSESQEDSGSFVCTTEDITAYVLALVQLQNHDVENITERRVERTLGKMRFQKAPRPGGKGSRRWRVTLDELQRLTRAYSLDLPPIS